MTPRTPAETEALRRFTPTIPFCERRREDFVAGAEWERDQRVYVLVIDFDCWDVRGVYQTLEDAQRAAVRDAEQEFTWMPYDRAEASYGPDPDQWFSSKGDIDGDPITYVVYRQPVRAIAQEGAAS